MINCIDCILYTIFTWINVCIKHFFFRHSASKSHRKNKIKMNQYQWKNRLSFLCSIIIFHWAVVSNSLCDSNISFILLLLEIEQKKIKIEMKTKNKKKRTIVVTSQVNPLDWVFFSLYFMRILLFLCLKNTTFFLFKHKKNSPFERQSTLLCMVKVILNWYFLQYFSFYFFSEFFSYLLLSNFNVVFVVLLVILSHLVLLQGLMVLWANDN